MPILKNFHEMFGLTLARIDRSQEKPPVQGRWARLH
jgi:hypothetical protein